VKKYFSRRFSIKIKMLSTMMFNSLMSFLISFLTGCTPASQSPQNIQSASANLNEKQFSTTIKKDSETMEIDSLQSNLEIATLGGGCFWCVEAVFDELEGVEKSISGYTGGSVENPTYREICYGKTGHAEVVDVYFDPKIIQFEDILRVFLTVHDPTTLNRQGNDIGTQYRSAIFYHSEAQKKSAEKIISEIEKTQIWNDKIVTEITKFTRFYKAEVEHQEYYKLNGRQPYCQFVITPKVAKFRKVFKDRLKKVG
jgi:peptide-methionine (S)-S-oxide reductase